MSKSYDSIKALCDEKGISIYKMCAEIGISKGLITELKSGRTKQLSAKNLSKVANFFGVPVEVVLGEKSESPLPFGSELSEKEMELLESVKGYSLQQMDDVIAHAASLKSKEEAGLEHLD